MQRLRYCSKSICKLSLLASFLVIFYVPITNSQHNDISDWRHIEHRQFDVSSIWLGIQFSSQHWIASPLNEILPPVDELILDPISYRANGLPAPFSQTEAVPASISLTSVRKYGDLIFLTLISRVVSTQSFEIVLNKRYDRDNSYLVIAVHLTHLPTSVSQVVAERKLGSFISQMYEMEYLSPSGGFCPPGSNSFPITLEESHRNHFHLVFH